MIIGENAKAGDLEVNPVRAKAATNMRTQNKDERVYLQPPKRMNVEELLGYMVSGDAATRKSFSRSNQIMLNWNKGPR